MNIEVSGLGKSFNNNRIFHNLTFEFVSGNSYAILGPNGSGKSTLLKIISGYMLPTSGSIEFKEDNKIIEPEQWYNYLSFAASYMELPQELTLTELLKFHYRFKGLPPDVSLDEIIAKCGLSGKESVPIKNFSSGMKQRLKLAISLFSRQEILLLDEPAVNLDAAGVEWYRQEVKRILGKKLVLIASNSSIEHDFCEKRINLSELK